MIRPEQSRDAWDRFATGYDEGVTPFSTRIAEEALSRVSVRGGTRFLDVAAGGGALSIPAARLGADVTAVDFSPAMVKRLNDHAREEGLSNLEARVMDGQDLDLEDDSFDVSGSQLGIMLFPDRRRGLSELARVTKPGGQAMMVVFASPRNVEIFSLFMAAVRAAVPDFTPPSDSPIFSLQDPSQLRSEMTEAGLKDVEVATVTHILEIESAARLWDMLSSAAPPVGALVSTLSDEQTATAQQALDKMLRERSGGGVARLRIEVHVGVGVK